MVYIYLIITGIDDDVNVIEQGTCLLALTHTLIFYVKIICAAILLTNDSKWVIY
jgi:hypothetical protein